LVNSVCPGYIDTDLTRANNSPEEIATLCEAIPLRRLAKPEEIAKLVYFLCSEDNTYITGQSIIVDGGFTVQ
jgi:3-oxoacyl-[acyl-carrier protein] reductase